MGPYIPGLIFTLRVLGLTDSSSFLACRNLCPLLFLKLVVPKNIAGGTLGDAGLLPHPSQCLPGSWHSPRPFPVCHLLASWSSLHSTSRLLSPKSHCLLRSLVASCPTRCLRVPNGSASATVSAIPANTSWAPSCAGRRVRTCAHGSAQISNSIPARKALSPLTDEGTDHHTDLVTCPR